jgi:hypothetical protein
MGLADGGVVKAVAIRYEMTFLECLGRQAETKQLMLLESAQKLFDLDSLSFFSASETHTLIRGLMIR